MISNFYIDESGNTGDLCKVGAHPNFGAQRFFGMACVGVAEPDELEDEFKRLRSLHRLQGSELKSTSLTKKPKVAGDLARFLSEKKWPVFIEIVDKHYMIMATLMERLIMPPVSSFDMTPKAYFIKTKMTEYLALYGPDELGALYAQACATKKRPDVRKVYRAIIRWAEFSRRQPEIAYALADATRRSLKDFEKQNPLHAVTAALPVPDRTKKDSVAWLLPNIPSFTNIYARVNRYTKGQMVDVTFIHDEQVQFDDILDQNKRLTEALKDKGDIFSFQHADYNFREISDLRFRRSDDDVGIQAADILAGFVTRYIYQRAWHPDEVHPDQVEAFEAISALQRDGAPTGVNFVVPDALLHYIGLIPDPNFKTRSVSL